MKKSMIILATLGAGLMQAQEEDNVRKLDSIKKEAQLEEVTVYSTRIPEKLSEIPASISIINSKELTQLTRNTTNINTLLEQSVPGLAPNTGTYSNWGQTLRGRKLMVMIDGVPQSTPLRNGQLSIRSVIPQNIGRVEVIKGATSIYGNGADGGFVNYITKNPEKNKAFSGTSQLWTTSNLAKTDDAIGVGLSQSFSGTRNKTSYHVNLFYEKTGNKYDAKERPLYPVYGLDNNKTYSFYGKVIHKFGSNDKHKITFSSQIFDARQHTPFGRVGAKLITDKNGDYRIEDGYGDKAFKNDKEEPTGLSTINLLSKYEVEDIFNNTSFTTDLYFQKLKGIFFYSTTFKDGGQSAIFSKKIGLRPNFTSKVYLNNANITLNYGLDLLRDYTEQGLLDGRVWIPELELNSYAPYVQSKLKFNNFWTIKTGLRYDNMNLKVPDYSTIMYSPNDDGNYNPSVDIKGGNMKFNNLSFNFGLSYSEYSKFVPYINYSQGYSLPDIGITLRSAKNPDIVSSFELEAATTNNYEFGFTSKFNHFRLEAVGYYTTSNIGTGLSFNNETNRFEASKDPQKIFGYEVSLDSRFFDNKLKSGINYTFVEGLKSPKDDKNSTSYTFVGGDVVAPPKFTAYISYKFSPKLDMYVNFVQIMERKRFNPILDKNGQYTYKYREVPIKPYSTVNISGAYKITPKMTATLGISNLLNKFYYPSRSQWAAPLGRFTVAGEGINGKLSLIYEF